MTSTSPAQVKVGWGSFIIRLESDHPITKKYDIGTTMLELVRMR